MPRWLRALLISAVATAAAAVVLRVLPGWLDEERGDARPLSPTPPKQRSTEEVVDRMSDEEKAQLLRELAQHV